MLAAAAPAANAPHDLSHEAIGIAGASETVSVAAMVADHDVAVNQLAGDGNAGELLTDAGMHRAKEFAFGK